MFSAASYYLDFGEIEAAAALADQIEVERWQMQWLDKLVRKLVYTGDFAEAERLAETIVEDYPGWRFAYRDVAEGLAAAGQYAEARRVLARVVNPGSRVDGYTRIGMILADTDPVASAGFLADAEALAAEIADPWGRVNALGNVGSAFAETGASEKAQAVAARLVATQAKPDSTSFWMREIALALSEAGQDDAASRLLAAAEGQAALIVAADERAQELQRLAEAHAKIGQFDAAERVAAGIDKTIYRIAALAKLGGYLRRPVRYPTPCALRQ